MVNSLSLPLFPLPQGSLACSCADCQSSCPIIPDTWDAPGEPWIMFGYDGLAVAMALTAVLFSVSFLVVFAYCHKRNKRYTGEWMGFSVLVLGYLFLLACPVLHPCLWVLDIALLVVPVFSSPFLMCFVHFHFVFVTVSSPFVSLHECPFRHYYFLHSDFFVFLFLCLLNSIKLKCFSFALYSFYCTLICHV